MSTDYSKIIPNAMEAAKKLSEQQKLKDIEFAKMMEKWHTNKTPSPKITETISDKLDLSSMKEIQTFANKKKKIKIIRPEKKQSFIKKLFKKQNGSEHFTEQQIADIFERADRAAKKVINGK